MFLRKLLLGGLLGTLLFAMGCGGHKDPPSPGQGTDAPDAPISTEKP